VPERLTRSTAADDRAAVQGRPDERLRLTRGRLLARGAASAGALSACGALVGALPRLAASQPSREQDQRILGWLLQVEYLQSAFYAEVERQGALRGELREFAVRVGEHERAHVEALRKRLGGGSPDQPEYDFGDAPADPRRFVAAAVELEEIAVSAFNGQIPNLTRERVMTAMQIVSVEARHVGWARDLAGRNPAPRPADRPATQEQTRAAMQATGFRR
jgi:Ferritin-like domain